MMDIQEVQLYPDLGLLAGILWLIGGFQGHGKPRWMENASQRGLVMGRPAAHWMVVITVENSNVQCDVDGGVVGEPTGNPPCKSL